MPTLDEIYIKLTSLEKEFKEFRLNEFLHLKERVDGIAGGMTMLKWAIPVGLTIIAIILTIILALR